MVRLTVELNFNFGYVHTTTTLAIYFGLMELIIYQPIDAHDTLRSALFVNPLTTELLIVFTPALSIHFEVFDYIFGQTRLFFFAQSPWYEKHTERHRHAYRIRHGYCVESRSRMLWLFRPFFRDPVAQIEIDGPDEKVSDSFLVDAHCCIDDAVDHWYIDQKEHELKR
jgi:hypothetical protein